MLPIYLVAVIVSGDDGWRMLVALNTLERKNSFVEFLKEDLDALTEGDWFVVASVSAGASAYTRAHDLGANTFMLEES